MNLRIALSLCCWFACGAWADSERAAKPADAGQDAELRAKPVQRCYGGMEDGKTIVRAADIANAAEQSTSRECRIGGGETARAPRSPSINAGRTVVA